MHLPESIRVQFYKFLDGQIGLIEFENWIYANETQIELALPEFHFELISFNYKQFDARDLFYKLIYYSIIDQASYAQWQLERLLTAIIRNENWEAAVSTLYWDFWDDNARYSFLMQIADYSAVLIFPPERFGLTNLVGVKREKVINRLLYPEIVKEAESILKSIENNDIRITGEKEYVDIRSKRKSNKTFQQVLLE